VPNLNRVFAFACRIKGSEHESIINHTTASKARRQYHLLISDPCPDVRYIDIRARKVGSPHTNAQFTRTAAYRGLPQLRCGQRVSVGGVLGTVVGHNSSANFDVLFDAGTQYAGLTLNVHPSGLTLIEDSHAASQKEESSSA
jgi:hypothetical protein